MCRMNRNMKRQRNHNGSDGKYECTDCAQAQQECRAIDEYYQAGNVDCRQAELGIEPEADGAFRNRVEADIVAECVRNKRGESDSKRRKPVPMYRNPRIS